MKEKKQNEELQSRREFFKEAAKKALPVIGAIAIASSPVLAHATGIKEGPTGCYNGYCTNTCSGRCTDHCTGTCYGSCQGTCELRCANDCTGGCKNSCWQSCSGGCSRNAYA